METLLWDSGFEFILFYNHQTELGCEAFIGLLDLQQTSSLSRIYLCSKLP